MSNESKRGDDITISFRLADPQATALRRIADQMKCQSLHETARNLLTFALEQQSARDEVRQLRDDIHELRTALARSVECLLMNAATELTDAQVKTFVFERLWPQSK